MLLPIKTEDGFIKKRIIEENKITNEVDNENKNDNDQEKSEENDQQKDSDIEMDIETQVRFQYLIITKIIKIIRLNY